MCPHYRVFVFHCPIRLSDFCSHFRGPDGRDESLTSPSAKRVCSTFVQNQQPMWSGVENIHPYSSSEDWSMHVRPMESQQDIESDESSSSAEKDVMDVEQSVSTSDRFARFPPRTQRSPTFWHKATAVCGAIVDLGNCALPLDDCRVRTWECSYGGCSDIN